MSGDPFANTTTVKNILQHIISPKLVTDGSGGYVSKTDVVNVHNLVFATGASTENGGAANPFTTQCGTIVGNSTITSTTVYHSRVTANSVIMVSIISGGTTNVRNVVPFFNGGGFVITCSGILPANSKLGWFIARF
jgi:hypothetical protein